MLTCTCVKSHADKPYTYTPVETVNNCCVHCGYHAVEFPNEASLIRPNHYLMGEAGNKFYRHCTKCGTACRLEHLARGTIFGECVECVNERARDRRFITGKTKQPRKSFK